ncbi:MAG: GAF domain-containing protein, partial [Phormidesmis sp. CAN_BIN36]|nr:GAF domain-containing protein [Phormidesmis sp. CAN_BIN36]
VGLGGREAAVFIVGGWAWGGQNLPLRLVLPFALVMSDAATRRIAFPPFHRAWWLRFYRPQAYSKPQDFIVLQVGIVIVLVCSTALISWLLRDRLDGIPATAKANLMIILLITAAFIAIAISCWTSLPQIMEIAEAREQADHLFQVASDAILVLDEEGSICQANPAAEILFETSTEHLRRRQLNQFLTGLSKEPCHWLNRSEQIFLPQGNELARVVEVAISDHFNQGLQQYMVVLRDVTERKQAETQLKHQAEQERLLKDISWRIRHSLDLNDILSTAVAEVRSLLQVERVTVYQLRAGSEGRFVVESTQSGCPSVLEIALRDPCFDAEYAQKYRQGWGPVIADIHQADLDPCHLDLLIRAGIRANLSVPIVVNECLWGLLCAHQCSEPRNWQPFEVDLLQQLGLQMAVAIQQSELYQQVQHLNNSLDHQVQERTAELQLALEFEAMLKRIGDKVRDSLDERQIFQTVVEELAQVLDLSACNTTVYDVDRGTATICHEYAIAVPPVQGQVVQMTDFREGYSQLLQGQYFQFCQLVPTTQRPTATLACPIVARSTFIEENNQQVLGDLWLFRSQHETFSDADIRLVQQVANQCAIATRQARLYQAVQTQVEELATLNQLKDDFLSTVSHELRTPVSNMKLSIRMLELTVDQLDSLNPVSEKANRYLQILNRECEREISLINDLLDLQRLETGLGTLDPELLQLESWLPQVAEAFRERTQSRQQILELDLAHDLPPMLYDRPSLERVLMELLNNACKYTPPGETITLSSQVAAGQLLICVTNSGVEIPECEQLQIFEKFHRVPNSDRWRQGGTGLGLTLVKKLTEHMGGTIQVTSGSGQTCFTIAKSILDDVG